jgi:CRISPR/Cas system CSM-associated protein Csm2 small subunit
MEKLSVPYGGNKERNGLRKAALIKRIAAIYGVDEKYTEYRVVRARYISPDGKVNFPYVFEVIVVPFGNIWANDPTFIGSVNNSVGIINGGKSLYDGVYRFNDKGKVLTAWNMDGILDRWYGYRVRESSRSWPCVIACNLLTPKVQWREQGKSTLVIEPFADTIINAINKVMKKIPTFHGMGLRKSTNKGKKEDGSGKPKKLDKIGCLRKILEYRYTQFEIESNTIDPEIMIKDRISQNDVYYTLRQTLFPENDIAETPGTRKYITARINSECRSLFKRHGQAGKKREDLGITAGHRAELYYMGNNQNISLDNVKLLSKYGTDAIFIEKEDGVILLDEPANIYGFALINTHGHMTEYGKEFVKAFTEENVSAVSFTDLDAAGVAIAAGAGRGIPRIGVTDEMLEYFGLERKDVDEEYKPTKSQITRVMKLVQKYELGLRHNFIGIRKYEDEETGEWIEEPYSGYKDYVYVHDELDYILGPKHDGRNARRIEISSVKAKLKSELSLGKYKEKFWNYVEKKLLEFSPIRDYTRVISSMPNLEHYQPDHIRKFYQYIQNHIVKITNDESNKIVKELREVSGFLNVKDKRREIELRLGKIVSEDEHLKDIATSIEELIYKKSLDK